MSTARPNLSKVDGIPTRPPSIRSTLWRRNFTPQELDVRLATDSHAPANFRAIGASVQPAVVRRLVLVHAGQRWSAMATARS